MKRELLNFGAEPQKIPLNILADMGFILEENQWVLNIGNPVEWFEVKLPLNPYWYQFREALAKSHYYAYIEGKTSKKE